MNFKEAMYCVKRYRKINTITNLICFMVKVEVFCVDSAGILEVDIIVAD